VRSAHEGAQTIVVVDGIANCIPWYYHHAVEVISIKLPEELRAKVAREARRRNVSQSTIVRESLERALAGKRNGRDELSCADLAGALVGSIHSRRTDLSTNKRLLAAAITAKSRRGRQRRR
jgi:Arc/MetJ-type ribon-helix-helix transcriptional regulator